MIKRWRMAATSARVAEPPGFSPADGSPWISPAPTAHAMASAAQGETASASRKPSRLPEAPAPFAPRDHALARAVLSLRPQLREAVLLCWYQELSAGEAARALGVSRSTVYNRLNKARRRLRGELEAWHEEK